MRVVRDRSDARWLPSRFRFAIFRLIALVAMSRATPREHKGLVLVIDPDQNAVQNHVLSAGAFVSASCFIAGALVQQVGWLAALLLCIPLALAAYSALVVALGVIVEPLVIRVGAPIRLARRINGLIQMALLLSAALYFSMKPSWVRPVALAFLTVVGVNVVASVLMLLLKSRVEALDRQVGVEG